MRPGASVLYLGAASGTSVSHVADIVGPEGRVYAVEFSHRSGRDLITMATHRTNVIPIIEDARHPLRYRMLVGMVDVIFADVAQPDQARIVGLNAHLFLKVGGGVLVSIKANCIDSTAKAEVVFASEVKKMRDERIKPKEQLTLGEFVFQEYAFKLTNDRTFRERSLCCRRSLPTSTVNRLNGRGEIGVVAFQINASCEDMLSCYKMKDNQSGTVKCVKICHIPHFCNRGMQRFS